MSGDHDVCPNCGAEAMWCDCDPDRKVERDAYIRGAKDTLAELYARMRQYMISSAFGPAGSFLTRLEREIDRGEWPPKEAKK